MSTLSHEDLNRLAMELSSYTRSGLPLPAGMREVANSLRNGNLRTLCEESAAALEKGQTLSQSLAASRVKVPEEFLSLVRCGEMGGTMDQVLTFAVEQSRRDKRHRDALYTTIIYPAIVLAVFFITFFFLSNYIVPKVQEIFDQLGAELPWLTKAVVGVSEVFSAEVGVFVLLGVVLLILAMLFVRWLREKIYRALSGAPGFRHMVALSDTTTAMKVLEFNLARGVPLPAVLSAASLAVWREESRDALQKMSYAAAQGQPVGAMLPQDCPSTAAWIFQQAEARGDLVGASRDIAAYCEDRFDRLSKRAIAVLEPMLVFFIALWIAGVLLAIYLPLFNIPKIVGSD